MPDHPGTWARETAEGNPARVPPPPPPAPAHGSRNSSGVGPKPTTGWRGGRGNRPPMHDKSACHSQGPEVVTAIHVDGVDFVPMRDFERVVRERDAMRAVVEAVAYAHDQEYSLPVRVQDAYAEYRAAQKEDA